MRLWPRRSKPDSPPLALTLAAVTPASFLAGRAALGVTTVDGEMDVDLTALPDDVLVGFVDAVLDTDTAPAYADRAALVHVATAVHRAWVEAVEAHNRRGRSRADAVCEAMNWWPDASAETPPLPEEMTASEQWATLRTLPLWEVVMGGQIAAARAARDKVMEPLKAQLSEHQRN